MPGGDPRPMPTATPAPKVVARRRRTSRIRRWVATGSVTLFVAFFALTSGSHQSSGASTTAASSSTPASTATSTSTSAQTSSPTPVSTSQS